MSASQRHDGIPWTDETWNPIRGCSRISAGCMRCYAERQAGRFINGAYRDLVERVVVNSATGATQARWTGKVELVEEALTLPLRWRTPRRIFVNSMSDLFHEAVPDEWIDAIFAVMALAPQHTFQALTKRAKRMRAYFTDLEDCAQRWYRAAQRFARIADFPQHEEWDWSMEPIAPPPNVWLGVSVEDQATADERIPLLLETPAAVRWASYEPALGPVEFDWLRVEPDCRVNALTGAFTAMGVGGPITASRRWPRLDWLVCGGESGPGARRFDLAWARSAIKQCRAAGIPVFVKQLGARTVNSSEDSGPWPVAPEIAMRWRDRKGADPAEWPEDLRVREWPKV